MKWLWIILLTLAFGCAAPQVKPEEGPCKPGEIVFGIDPGAWKSLGGSNLMAHPIYVYVCADNDQLHQLGLEAFYDGHRYQLFGKTYEHLNGFKDFIEMRDWIVNQRSSITAPP